MKIGSALLRQLKGGAHVLQGLQCHSLYTATDLTVCPGWRAVLPLGTQQALPVLSHRQLILDPRAIEKLVEVLIAP
jgi:triacylglycerol lipase